MFKQSISVFLCLLFVFNSIPLQASSFLQISIKKKIKQSRISKKHLGIIIATKDKTIYQLNAKKSFIPASLTKIFTAGALLDLLPPSQQFSTHFLAMDYPKNGILNGNLYLKGGGDPSFVSESLWNLVNHLTRTGLKKIKGDLILDDTLMDREHKAQRLVHSSRDSYDAPVGALSFNWNTVNIFIRPGKKIGDKLHIYIDPASLYFSTIQNDTKTLAIGKKSNLNIRFGKNCKIKNKKPATQSYSAVICFSGGVPVSSKERIIYKSITRPSLWTGWNVLAFLKERGIVLEGTVTRGVVPPTAIELAKWNSKPLSQQIYSMMKYSNNFMVEMLVKNLALLEEDSLAKSSNLTNKIGTLKIGLRFINRHIHYYLKIPRKEYRLIQPSGLSRRNLFKPKHLLLALRYWMKHPLQAEFESALPISGHDGTLKDSLSSIATRVHAKTGHLNGVVGLAGYARSKKAKKYLFVFIFNGSKRQSQQAENLFEQLLKTIITY